MSKRKRGGEDNPTEAQLVDSYKNQLRHKLFCKVHHRLCFVHGGVSPEHEEIDDMALGYWA